MARRLLRFGTVACEEFLIPFRCSTSISQNFNNSDPVEVNQEKMVNDAVVRSKMIRSRWKRYNWDDNPMVKKAFNEIIKGSHSFTATETYDAINHFNALSRKAKIPDYMAVKMASIVTTNVGWNEGKKILEMHYIANGAESRFAGEASILDEQVEGSVRRIFDNAGNDDTYEMARQFYCRLIDLRFCKVKNGVLKIFIQHLLNKNAINEAIDEFDYFSNYGKHGSLSGVAFLIVRAAFKKNDELFRKATEMMKRSVKSRLQQICILGCVFQSEGLHIHFVDFLREQNYSISMEDVEFICGLARNCKEPTILNSFLDVHELFKLTDEARARIYESLIEIYGKARDLNGLLKIWEGVVAEKNLNNFRIVILKLGHFYKCNDFLIPYDMQYYLKQYRE